LTAVAHVSVDDQALIAQPSMNALEITVLLRFSWWDVPRFDPSLDAPH
jgi:hypothetical protein